MYVLISFHNLSGDRKKIEQHSVEEQCTMAVCNNCCFIYIFIYFSP